MVADQFLLATEPHPAADHHHLKMTANLLAQSDNLDDNHRHHHHNHHHHHHHHHHNHDHDHHHHHERASSVTSDQYSSLNLSSLGSSAHHSPVIETAAGHPTSNLNHDQGAFSELIIATALAGNKGMKNASNSGHGEPRSASSLTSSSALSDYHGSIPCSPVESTGSPADDLLLLASSTAGQPHPLALNDHTSLKFETPQAQRPTSISIINNNNNNNHLHPDANHLHQNPHQKLRSYSHSNAFSPLVGAPSPTTSSPTGKLSTPDKSPLGSQENQRRNLLQQPQSIERPRRLSRIENRQSLHDLGYGRIESYFKLQRLGKGTYATVYMGRSKLSNDLVALKEILKEHDEGAPCTAIREVSLLRLLRHNNIVTLHDICHTPKKLTLVFEYVGPDLYAYMKENNHLLSIHNVRLLLYQLLRGIAFCHSRQVLHRDLKPQNLLINTRGELKICDFGLARAKSIPTKSYSNEVVTLWYRPPDVLLGNTDYDHSIDMWGVGCIFYEMASGRTFFPGSSVRQQLYLIFSSLGAPSAGNWPEILNNPEYLSYSFPSFRPEKLAHRVPRLETGAVQLLQSFLRFKPSERISAEEARRDPFFACLPERVHSMSERESIFDVPGVYMTLNPGQKLNHHNHHHHHHLQLHNH